ncbi:hypothetical protein F4553_000860 [Allocatelliglobosispora scoriae]|uniref:Ig-like domain-containing protein n=1 Tax=Allocatelliglobosispora scoriae TaxID=643052 RepID=A0A841BKU2_9ACTN|nr:hypothetical protein [Allocatelliglobosispora scoriae]MBB5867481.1 hypothetical protein [Allocatelliglobosispora scoriae]
MFRQAAAVLAIVTLATTLAVAPADAAGVDLICGGTNTATFTPGLTLTAQTVHIDAVGTLTSCVSSDAAITSGTYTASGNGTLSCLTGGHAGQFTISWNTGAYSTIAFTNSVAVRPLGEVVVLATGTVTSGEFAGDTYTGTFTLSTCSRWRASPPAPR